MDFFGLIFLLDFIHGKKNRGYSFKLVRLFQSNGKSKIKKNYFAQTFKRNKFKKWLNENKLSGIYIKHSTRDSKRLSCLGDNFWCLVWTVDKVISGERRWRYLCAHSQAWCIRWCHTAHGADGIERFLWTGTR